MVKEIILQTNKGVTFSESDYCRLWVEKRAEGYYFINRNQIEKGPFDRVFVEQFQKELFICGLNGAKASLFTVLYDGFMIETLDNSSIEFRKRIRNARREYELEHFPEYQFIDEVNQYRLVKEKKGELFFAKRDGYRRELLQSPIRHILQAPNGKMICVDPDNLKPFDQYREFDSFEDMKLVFNSKGYDFSPLPSRHNEHLSSLYDVIKFTNCIPTKWAMFILEKFKEMVGLEEYMNLQEPVYTNFDKHKLFAMNELIDEIKASDLTTLEKNVKEMGGYSSILPIIPAAIKEIEDKIPQLSSFHFYYTVDITYKGKTLSLIIPDKEEIKEAMGNPDYYDWRGAKKFHQDCPKGYEKLRKLEYDRCAEVMGWRFVAQQEKLAQKGIRQLPQEESEESDDYLE